MSNKDNLLDELLGITVPGGNTGNTVTTMPAVRTAKTTVVPADPIVVNDSFPESTQDDDAAYARRKMRKIISVAEDAVQELALIASDTQQPRAYEVLANLLKTASEATQQMMGIHKTRAEINKLNGIGPTTKFDRENEGGGGGINTGNQINVERAVFVGTATELLDALEQQKNNKKVTDGESSGS